MRKTARKILGCNGVGEAWSHGNVLVEYDFLACPHRPANGTFCPAHAFEMVFGRDTVEVQPDWAGFAATATTRLAHSRRSPPFKGECLLLPGVATNSSSRWSSHSPTQRPRKVKSGLKESLWTTH